MFIRIGYEIVVERKAGSVLILALSPHSMPSTPQLGALQRAYPDLGGPVRCFCSRQTRSAAAATSASC
jgi:hypothetical protein